MSVGNSKPVHEETCAQKDVRSAVSHAKSMRKSHLALVLACWFCCSCFFNYLAPQLVALVDNQDVTFLELGVTCAFGVMSLRLRGLALLPPASTLRHWALVGLLHLTGCRAFVWGLQFIPVSLAQTIRASSPLVAVPVAMLALGELYSWPSLAPLAPIVAGFAFSAGAGGGAEPDAGQLGGCAAAVASVCCLVMVNASCKYVGAGADVNQVQFWTVLLAFTWLLPFWAVGGGPQRLLAFEGNHTWLVTLVLADGCMYYLEQVLQQVVLRELPLLPFQVIDTLRRLVIVCVSGFLLQGNTCTALNALGITLVLSGAVAHNAQRAREQRQQLERQTPAVLREKVE
eukprot:TRINITY_DN30045_c0_g1_i1.p1 TRINITY_DN30045_c0_g1~~TRINITY_DN30045_c0_g1_i1.p1  ORF type:complete len:343 (-),score=81.02 TRINITY_DN30045_c0_g1_i1:79-1107(-)